MFEELLNNHKLHLLIIILLSYIIYTKYNCNCKKNDLSNNVINN